MGRDAGPAVLAVRRAVDLALADLAAGSVIVACSGGADSLALAGAAAWSAPRAGRDVQAVVIDHGLQEGSAAVAASAAQACAALGIPDTRVVTVQVAGPGGPEAAARAARYAALDATAHAAGAAAVLLAHTRDDQAETVLLGLARGSGARSLAGMRGRSGTWVRPFLHLSRATVHAACAELLEGTGFVPWQDPQNADASFARVRVRSWLASLGEELGPGVVSGLVRSADLLRDDADALDDAAVQALATLDVTAEGVDCAQLTDLPRAVRTRILRRLCLAAGSPAEDLTYEHITSIDALVIAWRGQGAVHLPGGVRATRACGRLSVT